ncbi:accessory Sec system translocase SecA2 [Exiguobacterium undae]
MFQIVKETFNEQSKRLKSYNKKVKKINELESVYTAMSDEDLQQVTVELKRRAAEGTPLEALTIEAFALVREASVRVLGMRHYDVQLIGGLALLDGQIAEMATGEGKTLVASLPSFTKALLGKGVHVITVNDYLAKRDVEQIGEIHRFLGLSVGLNVPDISPDEKRAAYASDITYGVGTEFGFDYLRDHLVTRDEDRVQRGHHFAIIDEVDSILIDEAKTPLIMAGKASVHQGLQKIARIIVEEFSDETEYEYDEEIKAVSLTETGINTIEEKFAIDNLFAAEHQVLYHYIVQALRAHVVMHRDVDYIVRDGKIELVDLFTGRIMEGRSLSDGLHQAIEAKEGLVITEENKTTAQVTIQHYFRMYELISGMTGTAQTSRQELLKTYGMDVVQVPTNRPKLRQDEQDIIYATKAAKYEAVAQLVKEAHDTKQPVLIGTTSIEQSLQVAEALNVYKIPYMILNAKTVDQETDIISQAGQAGRITIATNMAGRGTDITLDETAKSVGGLFVIGTERHESIRIDNQLRGRSGRQGDPGKSVFVVSLEDDLIRRFAKERLEKFLKKRQQGEDDRIVNKEAYALLSYAQETCEGTGYSIREELVKLDDVLHQHRLVIYSLRNQVIDAEDIESLVLPMVQKSVVHLTEGLLSEELVAEEWPIEEFTLNMNELLNDEIEFPPQAESVEEVKQYYVQLVAEKQETWQTQLTEEQAGEVMREQLLTALEECWTEHLTTMNTLKEGIHLRSYGQEQPSRMYEKEGFEIFNFMLAEIEYRVTYALSRLTEYVWHEEQVEISDVGEIEKDV